MSPMTFGPSFLPELREILLSTGEATYYGPDGKITQIVPEPFLGRWQLRALGYDPQRGESLAICVLTATDGRDVTATIDVKDFRGLRRNSSRSPRQNGSDRYHDLAVYVSVLVQEQILTYDPDSVSDQVRIQSPVDRAASARSGTWPRRGA